jgi:hypothetical protein
MYKITSKIIGSIKIEGKELGYNAYTFVTELTPKLIDMLGLKLIKADFIAPIETKNENLNTNKSKQKKKNNSEVN